MAVVLGGRCPVASCPVVVVWVAIVQVDVVLEPAKINLVQQTLAKEGAKQVQSHDFLKNKNKRRFFIAHYTSGLPKV